MARNHSIDFSWYRRAQDSIAGAALTNSKRPETFVKGIYPTHLAYAKGCNVIDTGGKIYIDFICGLGTNLIGYGNERIAQAIFEQARRGICPSLSTHLEVEAAEKVKEKFCFVEKLRFLKTGSHACQAAVKISRAYTGRTLVLSEGYHGDGDEFISLTPPAIGVNDHPEIKALDFSLIKDAACVIVEPVMLDDSTKRITWLKQLREECTKHNTVLIFDEIITGYRYPLLSVSRKHGITPDLICIGKAMAGGAPLSVVGGKKEIMECDEYFVSSTFAGETLSLAAFMEFDALLSKFPIKELWDAGGDFKESFNSIWDGVQLDGYNTRGRFVGSPLNLALFFQESVKAGLLFGPSWFYCFPHIELKDKVLNLITSVMYKIRTGQVKLEGEMPRSPFSDRSRNGRN